MKEEILELIEKGELKRLREIINRIPREESLSSIRDEHGEGPLHWAINANANKILRFLLELGLNPNASSSQGTTPMHIAAWKGNLEGVKILGEFGARVDLKDAFGRTPLFYSVRFRHLKLSDLLIKRGADPREEDIFGMTPLDYAILTSDLQMVDLLLKRGSKPSKAIYPLLTLGIRANRMDLIKLARRSKSWWRAVNEKDEEGRTPLHLAVLKKDREIVEYLLRNGANPNARDNKGKTPLHYAAEAKDHNLTLSLMLAKSDPLIKDAEGRTPLDYLPQSYKTSLRNSLIRELESQIPSNPFESPIFFIIWITLILLISLCEFLVSVMGNELIIKLRLIFYYFLAGGLVLLGAYSGLAWLWRLWIRARVRTIFGD